MPEVRLAWRAASCYGSPRGQVVIGIAPHDEQHAITRVLPADVLRRYPLNTVGHSAAQPPIGDGLGVSRDCFGVVPLDNGDHRTPDRPWDSLVTIAIRGVPELARFARAIAETPGHGESVFVAAIGWTVPLERTIFSHVTRDCTGLSLPDLRRRIEEICRRLAGTVETEY